MDLPTRRPILVFLRKGHFSRFVTATVLSDYFSADAGSSPRLRVHSSAGSEFRQAQLAQKRAQNNEKFRLGVVTGKDSHGCPGKDHRDSRTGKDRPGMRRSRKARH